MKTRRPNFRAVGRTSPPWATRPRWFAGMALAGLLMSSCGSSGVAQGSLPPTSTTTTSTTSTTIATAPAPGRPLTGMVVGIDPGHNGLNYSNVAFINHIVFNGRAMENCDTTGTATASRFSEAQFNFNVAMFLKVDLETEGARVVLTRMTNSGVGPCIDRRAQILNSARVNVAIDIHADGGPTYGRGFAILEPVADGPNNSVIASSVAFGVDVRTSFLAITGMPLSTYDGVNGLKFRDDLAGLNLTTVPKVLIECGNMRNTTDAVMLMSTKFQRLAARGLAVAITNFLHQRQH